MDTIRLLRPFPDSIRISSPLGPRKINGIEEFHKGYDFATPVGTEVLSCADGAVFRAGFENEEHHDQGFGLRIWQEIEIEKIRYYLWIGHLSKLFVKEGDRIKPGQVIALTGNSGRTTGPHCHLGARIKDTSKIVEIEWVSQEGAATLPASQSWKPT